MLLKSSKHFWFPFSFHLGKGDTPSRFHPTRHFVPQTRASPHVYENARPLFHQILDPPLTRYSLISFYCFAEKTLSPGFLEKNLSPVLSGKKKSLPLPGGNKSLLLSGGENKSPPPPLDINWYVPNQVALTTFYNVIGTRRTPDKSRESWLIQGGHRECSRVQHVTLYQSVWTRGICLLA